MINASVLSKKDYRLPDDCLIKFGYSEKATKFKKNLPLGFDVTE